MVCTCTDCRDHNNGEHDEDGHESFRECPLSNRAAFVIDNQNCIVFAHVNIVVCLLLVKCPYALLNSCAFFSRDNGQLYPVMSTEASFLLINDVFYLGVANLCLHCGLTAMVCHRQNISHL